MSQTRTSPARCTRNPPTLPRLEQQLATQQTRINRGVQAGTLSAEEGKKLQARLDAVRTNVENDAFDGNGLSRGQKYAHQLQGLSKEFGTKARDGQVDSTRMLANIDRRIANGLKDGSLTPAEADALKAKAAGVREQLASSPPAETAAKALHALSKEVFKERHDGELDSTKRQANFEQRIAAGLADGSLTQKEADALRKRAAEVQATGSSDAKKNNGLDRAIWRQRHDGQMNVDAAKPALEQRIAALETAGKLSPEQASAFRTQLSQLSQQGAEAVGPRLNVLRTRLAAFA